MKSVKLILTESRMERSNEFEISVYASSKAYESAVAFS